MKKTILALLLISHSAFAADPEDTAPTPTVVQASETARLDPEREIELVIKWERDGNGGYTITQIKGTTVSVSRVIRNGTEVKSVTSRTDVDMLPLILAKIAEAPATNQTILPGWIWTAAANDVQIRLQKAPTGIVRKVRE